MLVGRVPFRLVRGHRRIAVWAGAGALAGPSCLVLLLRWETSRMTRVAYARLRGDVIPPCSTDTYPIKIPIAPAMDTR